jgi:hypothetical protein
MDSRPGLSCFSLKFSGHEVLDDAVKARPLVVQRLAGRPHALLTRAQRTEVLGRHGDDVGEELEDKAAGGLATDGDVEEDAGVCHVNILHCGNTGGNGTGSTRGGRHGALATTFSCAGEQIRFGGITRSSRSPSAR